MYIPGVRQVAAMISNTISLPSISYSSTPPTGPPHTFTRHGWEGAVCLYEYKGLCAYMCVDVCMYVFMYECTFIYIYMYIYIFKYINVYIFIRI